jgi:hypothetical protein
VSSPSTTISSLSAAGVLSGVPAKAGTYAFTVTATNAITSVKLQTRVTILPVQASPLTGTPPVATAGVPYHYQLTVTGTPAPTTRVTDPSALPPGITLDPATATLSGTPRDAGTFDLSLVATSGVAPDA